MPFPPTPGNVERQLPAGMFLMRIVVIRNILGWLFLFTNIRAFDFEVQAVQAPLATA
jgi:hypothetical protein